MNEIVEFLTSKEIIVVYIVVAVALLLCLIIYFVDKSYDKRKRRQNTRKLNRLVEDVNLRLQEEEEKSKVNHVDKASFIEPKSSVTSTSNYESVDDDFVPNVLDTNDVSTSNNVASTESVVSDKKINNVIMDNIDFLEEEAKDSIDAAMSANINRVHDKIEQIVYTSSEPDKEEATRELLKLTEEIEKAEQATRDGIDIADYENAQEENAIISLEELTKRSEEMYAANELTQYADEGDEPISLSDLEARKAKVINSEFTPSEKQEEKVNTQVKHEQMSFENAYLGHKPKQNDVFSSVFGSSSRDYQSEEELEKTSQFLMNLKELQNRLNS